MSRQYKITESDHELSIELIPEIAPIVKIIAIITGIAMIALSVQSFIMLVEIILQYPEEILTFQFVFSVALLLVYLFAGIFLIKYATRKDLIIMDHEKLLITKNTFLTKKNRDLFLSDIEKIKLCEPPEFTDHPLSNTLVDPTGVVVGEKGVQYLSDPGKIEIQTAFENIYIGPKIAEWDAEIIIEKMNAFLNNHNKVLE